MSVPRVVLLLVVLLGAAACYPQSSGGGSPPPGPISREEFRAQLLPAVCHVLAECHRLPEDSCLRAQLVDHALDELDAMVATGRLRFDGQRAERCIHALKFEHPDRAENRAIDLSFDENQGGLRLDELGGLGAPCRNVYQGDAADGTSCLMSEECASFHCARPDCSEACCTGVCAPPKYDLPCDSDDTCGPVFFCDRDLGQCRNKLAFGQPCQAGQCGYQLFCAIDPRRPPADGPRCMSTNEVPCRTDLTLLDEDVCWRIDQACDPTGAPNPGRCWTLPEAGQPCFFQRFVGRCRPDAVCLAGVCRALAGIGEPCGELGCYDFLRCDEQGICGPPRAPEPCTCGDGVLDPGEACDDGNTQSGDACAADCSA